MKNIFVCDFCSRQFTTEKACLKHEATCVSREREVKVLSVDANDCILKKRVETHTGDIESDEIKNAYGHYFFVHTEDMSKEHEEYLISLLTKKVVDVLTGAIDRCEKLLKELKLNGLSRE